jgi:hypothetical protein
MIEKLNSTFWGRFFESLTLLKKKSKLFEVLSENRKFLVCQSMSDNRFKTFFFSFRFCSLQNMTKSKSATARLIIKMFVVERIVGFEATTVEKWKKKRFFRMFWSNRSLQRGMLTHHNQTVSQQSHDENEAEGNKYWYGHNSCKLFADADVISAVVVGSIGKICGVCWVDNVIRLEHFHSIRCLDTPSSQTGFFIARLIFYDSF